jgi:hypothetical protein
MPPYDLIMRVALEHADWWVRVHNAVRGASEVPVESFPEFVQRNYTSNRPSEVGTIAIAYAFSCEEDAPHLYALVNRLVVSDMAYVSTVEGLECLILLAILYADEGQARRSWMIWRRGVVVAQLTVCEDPASGELMLEADYCRRTYIKPAFGRKLRGDCGCPSTVETA